MATPQPVIISEPWTVSQELRSLGLTVEVVTHIARQAAAARAESLPEVDPCGTPGTFSYIHGVRAVRLRLIPNGWNVSRFGNVESTVNHNLGVQLIFQNVDVACRSCDPQAISGKGAGSRKLVEYGRQGELFERHNTQPTKLIGVMPTVWAICVSTDEKRLRAEVSCPLVFEGVQFEGFSKRIFVVDEDFDPIMNSELPLDGDSGDDDVEVRIFKKS